MSDTSLKSSLLPSIVVVLLALGAASIAWYGQLPPRPKPASAPATEFSAERALAHIKQIASVPHAAGTFADDAVRAYLVKAMKDLGIEAFDQECVNSHGSIGIYHNVMARIPGTANTKAFAMAAHHDSVPYGPGATDDCGGVGAMIETARALLQGPRLKNDVIFVFTDAEEFSGGGADAFTQYPWAKDVGIMLNFEARGVSGPSYMFETSEENGWLITELAKTGVDVRATSVMFDAYRRSPFGSDFGQFKRAGLMGYNIAFIDNFCYYHTREDRPERASLASLQHHGEYALGMARYFGGKTLEPVRAPDATYFNTIGSHFVHYPISWGKPLAIAASILLAAVFVLGLILRRMTIGGLIAAIFAITGAIVCSVIVIGLLAGLLYLIYGRYLIYYNNLFCIALACIANGVGILILNLLHRRIKTGNLVAAALLWWLALLWAAETYIAGGAYLALWPLVFGALGAAVYFMLPSDERPWPIVAITLFVIPGILLLVPSAIGFLELGTLLVSPMLGLFIILLGGLLMPQLALVQRASKYAVPVAAVACGVLLMLAGIVLNVKSPDAPRFSCLSYGCDLDAGKAYWLSNDAKPDEWLSKLIPANTPRELIAEFIPGDGKYLKAAAPLIPIQDPFVKDLRDETAGGKRTVAFHLGSDRDISRMNIEATGAEVFTSSILGRSTGPGRGGGWGRSVALFPRGGVDILLTTEPNKPLRIKFTAQSYGLPAALNLPPRPPSLVTEPNTTLDFHRPLRSEHTYVIKTINL
jgi:hypothetical protein